LLFYYFMLRNAGQGNIRKCALKLRPITLVP